ncbi:MAG: cobalamin B12-binding domain-containing protein [Planctomycetaceae bacterium]
MDASRDPATRAPYRVVVAKPGLDGHDRGAKVVARALRDAGFEVIYTGLWQTPPMIAEVVLEEDADALGLSTHSGAHMTLFPAVMDELRARDLDVPVFAGGIVPERDVEPLRAIGIERVFPPGTSLPEIVTWVRERLMARDGGEVHG